MEKKQVGKPDPRIIFHIDVNSAFLSWFAVKKLREDPGSVDLRTIPAVVGGDPGSRHGIVTAKSLPAKKYGIRTAETIASALQKCPGLVIVPSDFQTYREFSHSFIGILRDFTPLVEQASIDEAYMDATALVSAISKAADAAVPEAAGPVASIPGAAVPEAAAPVATIPESAAAGPAILDTAVSGLTDADTEIRSAALMLAEQIRRRIKDQLGFTVNVGISTNRLLAKMASDFEKPDRTHTLFPEEVPAKMWPLPIGDLYGCGGRTSERLRTLGIRTIGDAAKAPEAVLTDHLGEKSVRYIHRAANGIGRAVVSPVRESAKSYSNEWTTSSDIRQETYEAEYLPLLRHLCGKVADRLQRDGVYGRTVVVTVKTDDFRRRSAQTQLPDATNTAATLYDAAVSLSDKLLLGEHGLFAEGAGIRLVGAGVTNLDNGSYRQMSLLDWEPEEVQAAPAAEEKGEAEEIQAAQAAETNEEPVVVPAAQAAETNEEPAEIPAANERATPEKRERDERLRKLEALISERFGNGAVKKGQEPI